MLTTRNRAAREFHTFITLSAKKFLRIVFVVARVDKFSLFKDFVQFINATIVMSSS